jgi:hypothetical protein
MTKQQKEGRIFGGYSENRPVLSRVEGLVQREWVLTLTYCHREHFKLYTENIKDWREKQRANPHELTSSLVPLFKQFDTSAAVNAFLFVSFQMWLLQRRNDNSHHCMSKNIRAF